VRQSAAEKKTESLDYLLASMEYLLLVFLSEADCCNNYSVHLFCLSTFQPPHLRVKKIFVGGLKPETTDQQIREYFGSKYAPVGFDNSKHFLWTLFING